MSSTVLDGVKTYIYCMSPTIQLSIQLQDVYVYGLSIRTTMSVNVKGRHFQSVHQHCNMKNVPRY